MDDIDSRYELIEGHEQHMAKAVAARIIPRPELSVWMVLIPIMFVFYFYQRERYRSGSEQFQEHYLVSRRRALNAARNSTVTGEDVDLPCLVEAARVPESAREAYAVFLQVLIDHYQLLLETEGSTYGDLVRAAYAGKTNYLLFCKELNQGEKDLNAALAPQLAEEAAEGCGETIRKLEQVSAEMRREEAESIFGNQSRDEPPGFGLSPIR